MWNSLLFQLGQFVIEEQIKEVLVEGVRPEKFQFLEKGQNRNFDYKIIISVKNP